MRITLNIPDELMAEAQKTMGEKSRTKAIVAVLQEYVAQRKIQALLALRGKAKEIEYDWQQEEEREMQAQREREKLFET